MSRRRTLRKRWFDKGKEALGKHIAEEPGYGCPLCLRAAPVVEAFTVEDVPPVSVGGCPLVLTCRECNSRAGHDLDAHVARGQLIRSFARGEKIRPTKDFKLRIDDASVPISLAATEGGVSLIGHERAGSPASRAAITHHFEDAVATSRTDWELHLDFPSFSQRKERLGWLRAGYLAAFAKLGYAYILRPEVRPVIEQLQDVESDRLSDYIVWNVGTASPERRMVLVEQPAELQSIAVTMGQATVFLPSLDPGTDIYSQLPLMREQGELQVSGKEMPWPREPEFALDFVVAQ